MISAIILSAGTSPIGGIPKSLPKAEVETFLHRILKVLHSARITDIVIVLHEDYEKICGHLSNNEGKIVFIKPPKSGETASIRAGIDNISKDDAHGVMICTIDRPLVTQKQLVKLLQAFWHSKKNIIIPSYNRTRGYPIIFGTKLYSILRAENVKAVIQNHQDEIHEVQSDENGTIITVSSLEEYQKYSGVL